MTSTEATPNDQAPAGTRREVVIVLPGLLPDDRIC
jgi:hypothetical protein